MKKGTTLCLNGMLKDSENKHNSYKCVKKPYLSGDPESSAERTPVDTGPCQTEPARVDPPPIFPRLILHHQARNL